MKKLIIIAIGLVFILLLSACAPDVPDITPVPEVEEVENVEPDDDGNTEEVIVEAPADSNYAGVNLSLDEIVNTATPAGAAAGTLQLVISFENTTDETVTLPFGDDDYTITDDAGFNTVPAVITPELINPEIAAGETVSGVLEYSVMDATGTFTFHVGTFEGITFSESVSD